MISDHCRFSVHVASQGGGQKATGQQLSSVSREQNTRTTVAQRQQFSTTSCLCILILSQLVHSERKAGWYDLFSSLQSLIVSLCLNLKHHLDSDIDFHHICAGWGPDMWRQRSRLMETDKPPAHVGRKTMRESQMWVRVLFVRVCMCVCVSRWGVYIHLFFVCLCPCLSECQAVKSNCNFIYNCTIIHFSIWKHPLSECEYVLMLAASEHQSHMYLMDACPLWPSVPPKEKLNGKNVICQRGNVIYARITSSSDQWPVLKKNKTCG